MLKVSGNKDVLTIRILNSSKMQTKITTFDDHNLLLEIVTHLKLVKLGMNICVLI